MALVHRTPRTLARPGWARRCCACDEQNGDGYDTGSDLIAINRTRFTPVLATAAAGRSALAADTVRRMAPGRPTRAEREHFRRIAEANAAAESGSSPPASLREMFDRLDALHRALGRFAQADPDGEDLAELDSHLRVVRRLRSPDRGGSRRG
jgi:hypothetical protein